MCACDEMQIYKYCHCLLFVREDGLPITEYLPEGHEGRKSTASSLIQTLTRAALSNTRPLSHRYPRRNTGIVLTHVITTMPLRNRLLCTAVIALLLASLWSYQTQATEPGNVPPAKTAQPPILNEKTSSPTNKKGEAL